MDLLELEMFCMENLNNIPSQVSDQDLIPKGRNKESKGKIEKALNDILEEQIQQMRVFWGSVIQEIIMDKHPTLRLMPRNLTDEEEEETEQQHEYNYDYNIELKLQSFLTEAFKKKRKEFSEDEDEEENPGKRRKRGTSRMCNNEELPGPSSQLTPDEEEETEQQHEDDHDCYIYDENVKEASRQTDVSFNKEIMWEGWPPGVFIEDISEDEDVEEKPGKKQRSDNNDNDQQPGPSSQLTPASALKNKEKDDVRALVINKSELPVTCGDLEATLYKDRLEKGEECILFQNQWFTPGEFDKFAMKERSKNWKRGIRCYGISLRNFIEKGLLKAGKYTAGSKKTKKSQGPSDQSRPDKEEETEQQQETDNDRRKMVFKVTCEGLAGTLHKDRFASGDCGKSIRTETSWLSPVEFVKEASGQTDACWESDIKCEGKPLSVLIEENAWMIHSDRCKCKMCKANQEDPDNQKHDDECCVCKSDEGPVLVVCDHCPRTFHPKCHLPHVEDDILVDDKKWMCTFCAFKTIEELRYKYFDELKMEEAMSQQISLRMLECQYLLLFLYNADEEQMLALDPNQFLKNYSTVIKSPMWLGEVADKLQKKKYQTVGEFVSDVQLIFTNCAKYNRDEAEFFDSGRRLKGLFDGEFKKVFKLLTD